MKEQYEIFLEKTKVNESNTSGIADIYFEHKKISSGRYTIVKKILSSVHLVEQI